MVFTRFSAHPDFCVLLLNFSSSGQILTRFWLNFIPFRLPKRSKTTSRAHLKNNQISEQFCLMILGGFGSPFWHPISSKDKKTKTTCKNDPQLLKKKLSLTTHLTSFIYTTPADKDKLLQPAFALFLSIPHTHIDNIMSDLIEVLQGSRYSLAQQFN